MNNQILELEQLHYTTSTCKNKLKIASSVNNTWVDGNWVLDYWIIFDVLLCFVYQCQMYSQTHLSG